MNKKEKIKHAKAMKDYFQTSGGRFQLLKSNSRRRGVEINISRDEFINWFEKQQKVCYYCSTILVTGKGVRKINSLTIERLDNSKGYCIDNIVLACTRCNKIKNNDLTESDMLEIGEIIKRRRLIDTK